MGLYLPESNFVIVSGSIFIENQNHLIFKNAKLYQNLSSVINCSFSGTLDPTVNGLTGQLFIQLPCNNGFNISSANFSNINDTTSTLLQGCDTQYPYYASTDEVYISKIRYSNFSCRAVQFKFDKFTLIYDVDGTFTQNAMPNNSRLLLTQAPTSMTVIPNLQYLVDPGCFNFN